MYNLIFLQSLFALAVYVKPLYLQKLQLVCQFVV